MLIIPVVLISYLLGRFDVIDIVNLTKVIVFLAVSYYIGESLRIRYNKYIRKMKNDDLISKLYFNTLGSIILIVLYYIGKYMYKKYYVGKYMYKKYYVGSDEN